MIPFNKQAILCNMSLTVSFPRCDGAGTPSVVPAVWIASPQGYNNVMDSNQYRSAWRRIDQLDSTSLSIPLLVMNQHPLSPEDQKKKPLNL